MKKILLVEDNETIVMGLKYSLEQENFQVISAKRLKKIKIFAKRYFIFFILSTLILGILFLVFAFQIPNELGFPIF